MLKKINFVTLIAILAVFSLIELYSAPGDTTKIRAIEFQQRRIGWVNFPNLDFSKVDRILMNYKLRCPPGKPCGEWDYLAYVEVAHFYSVNFRVNKSFPSTYSYMKDTSWAYKYENGNVVKTAKTPSTLYLYDNSENPTVPTDSMMVWPTYYSDYKFDSNGKATDSTFVEPDAILQREFTSRVYFNDENTFQDNIEIFRYITPYGNGLSLGDGVTWVIDVSDFIELLTGKVFIHAQRGGWGDQYDQNVMEDLELTFDIIEGTPPRNPIKMTKLWDYNGVRYDNNIETKLTPYDYTFSTEEKNAIVRVTQTGHGFGATADNCAEFCDKESYISVNGTRRFTRNIWRECGDNPIYPQGGTWIYDRSNWCPGAEVTPFDYDISQYLTPNSTNTIDYDMEPYNLVVTGDGSHPNWVIRGFLFTYGEPNFKTDVRLTDIITPSNDPLNNRSNPMIGGANIEIQNTGSNPIESITVKYGNDVNNLAEYTATLEKAISLMEKTEVFLPFNNWFNPNSPDIFYVEITNVNAANDEYIHNNKGQEKFIKKLPEVPNNFIVEFIGNNSDIIGISSPYTYIITDKNNKTVFNKEKTNNNQTTRDTISLEDGPYTFVVQNPYGYGFGFWAYAQNYGLKNAQLRFIDGTNLVKNMPADWGNYYVWSFEVTAQVKLLSDVNNNKLPFGEVNIGEKQVKEVKIFAANSKGLEITEIKLPLSSTKKFTIIDEKSTATPDPRKLTDKDTITLKIEFEPLTKGIKTSNLLISSNDKYNGTALIEISGNGIDPSSVDDLDISSLFEITLENENNNNLNVSINPITEQNLISYSISNLEGNVMLKSEIIGNSFSVDIQNFSSGIYFITFYSNNGAVNKKFSIVR